MIGSSVQNTSFWLYACFFALALAVLLVRLRARIAANRLIQLYLGAVFFALVQTLLFAYAGSFEAQSGLGVWLVVGAYAATYATRLVTAVITYYFYEGRLRHRKPALLIYALLWVTGLTVTLLAFSGLDQVHDSANELILPDSAMFRVFEVLTVSSYVGVVTVLLMGARTASGKAAKIAHASFGALIFVSFLGVVLETLAFDGASDTQLAPIRGAAIVVLGFLGFVVFNTVGRLKK